MSDFPLCKMVGAHLFYTPLSVNVYVLVYCDAAPVYLASYYCFKALFALGSEYCPIYRLE
jgi:hypothetical protein